MGSLLEKAKKVKAKRSKPREITKEHVELALAWAREEITHTQVARALGGDETYRGLAIYVTLARSLKKYIRSLEK